MDGRLFHEPSAEQLLAHLRDHYGVNATAATKASQHNDHVFRVDRSDGDQWIVRVYPPARPRMGVEGDAAILRFLERRDYPAERLAVDDPHRDEESAREVATTELPDVGTSCVWTNSTARGSGVPGIFG